MQSNIHNSRKGILLKYTYTDDDIKFLEKYYPNGEWDKIMDRFPTLQRSCIYKKCKRLGIKSNNTHRQNFDNSKSRNKWTQNEIDILVNNYSNIEFSEVCKLLPNRNENMILGQARRMGLISFTRTKQLWKDYEIQYIIDNWELVPDKIMADTLHKTFRAVKYKREELGLFRQNQEDRTYPTLSKYLRGQNQKWKKDSMLSCNYKCVLTDSKDFEIHHLYGVSNIINDILNEYTDYRDKPFEEMTDEDLSFLLDKFLEEQGKYPLGVCVDKKLHILFHSMYGQYYNTPEQWKKFCEDYKNGIYDKYI